LQFLADEGSEYTTSSSMSVTIIDDTIDEMEEYSVLSLQLVDALFPHQVTIERYSSTTLHIIDDDGMPAMLICFVA